MPQAVVILASILGGGLSGAFVSIAFNRVAHWRALRTKFYPILNDMFSAYVIRMERPEGRYWNNVIGYLPAEEDRDFVEHRSTFISDLIQYNELKEVRVLRKKTIENSVKGEHEHGKPRTHDLAPELAALRLCMGTLHKKLRLDE